MKRLIIPLAIAMLPSALFLSGCSDTENKSGDSDATISITELSLHPGNNITFSGDTTFADGTVFQAQLYIDGEPQTWWPTDRTFRISGGKWLLSVVLVGLGPGVEQLDADGDTDFTLRVRVQDKPEIYRDMDFDFSGPPLL